MDYYNYLQNANYMRSFNYNFESERLPDVPWPLEFQNRSIQYNLNKAITKVKDSVQDEKEDETFYDFLINATPNNDSKEIIQSIRDDERIHNKLLRHIFTELTGVILPPNTEQINLQQNLTYIEGLKKALFGELKAIEKYREIMAYMPNMDLYNMVLYIMTDEMKHANKYNYLITSYLVKV